MIPIMVVIFEKKSKEIDVVLMLLTDHHAGGDAVDVEEVKPIVYEAVGIPLFIRFIKQANLNIIWKTEVKCSNCHDNQNEYFAWFVP